MTQKTQVALQRRIFFFNDTATTEIYTLSLHDALPICRPETTPGTRGSACPPSSAPGRPPDRKSTRLNSSHDQISYAVFCLKKTLAEAYTLERPEVVSEQVSTAGTRAGRGRTRTAMKGRQRHRAAARFCHVFVFFLRRGRPRLSPLSPPGPPLR